LGWNVIKLNIMIKLNIIKLNIIKLNIIKLRMIIW